MSASANNNPSSKYSTGHYVKIKSQNEFGTIKSVTQSPHGVWYYEIESIDKIHKYIAAEDSIEHAMQVVTTGQATWTPTPSTSSAPSMSYNPIDLDNWDDGRDADQWISGADEGYGFPIKEASSVTSKPKCECGLHAVDPKRNFGHSNWCPVSTNTLT